MLFRNLKSGNVVAATDETSIELMQRSAIYEAVEIAPAVAPAPAKAEGKLSLIHISEPTRPY